MDTDVIDDLLAGYFGAAKGVNAPASHTLHLFATPREVGGVELVNGFTPPTITNDGTSWPAPSSGLLTGAAVNLSFTATLEAPAQYYALKDPAGKWLPSAAIPDGPISGGSGVSETVIPTLVTALTCTRAGGPSAIAPALGLPPAATASAKTRTIAA